MSSLSSEQRNVFQHPEPGDCIDIFKLGRKIHTGALATLFLARDQLSQQQVVLKIPCGDILNQPILLYHYQNEERISRFLDHPGIVRFIYRQRSRQYIIMEHINGSDLRSRVGRNRHLPLEQALTIMDQLCEVVGYLHRQEVFHLDLKPENIICCPETGIKLIDFGLASCGRLPDLLTLDLKYPQGTPWYIAPEQLLGERADPRCDIYAMGMILYEMVTGQLPWPRSGRVTVARRRLCHDPIPPRQYNRRIPAQIQSIILRALARHSCDRYQRAAEFQEELSSWQQLPVTAAGLNGHGPPFWKRLFPGRPVRLQEEKKAKKPKAAADRVHIIAALVDADSSDQVLAEVKKQALLARGEVTLVHVIEEESDSHARRYGMVVEGEQLMIRLEQAVQLLRRCSIDPCIRLIRGDVVAVLTELCHGLNPELLVIGKSRKTGTFSGKGSVVRALSENDQLPLLSAEEKLFSVKDDLVGQQPDQLTDDQILATDIFLVDLWYEHLRYHSDFIYDKLLHPEIKVNLDENNCQLGRFLTVLEGADQWQQVRAQLEPIHAQFHDIARRMDRVGNQDHVRLQQLYVQESLPLSCYLKEVLGQLSILLRAPLAEPPPAVPFLMDRHCPIGRPDLVCYGPLLRVFDLHQDLSDLIQARQDRQIGQEQN
jgi:nucleotide-binding universal stress UspA family protein